MCVCVCVCVCLCVCVCVRAYFRDLGPVSIRQTWTLSPIFLRQTHTPSTAFRHLPPNSARFSYAIEGALFISAQLSSDAVSALRKVRVLRSNLAPKHARKHETHPPRVKRKKRRKKVLSRFKRLWFYLCWRKLCWPL